MKTQKGIHEELDNEKRGFPWVLKCNFKTNIDGVGWDLLQNEFSSVPSKVFLQYPVEK